MANKAQWPQLGVQPQNLNEYITQLIAEATALLALDRGQRPKLLDRLFESFINSVQTYTRKPRKQPSSHKILNKLNQIHNLTKSFSAKDITLIKNAVNHTITQSSAQNPHLGRKGQVQRTRHLIHLLHQYLHPSTIVSKDREIIIKLDSPELTTLYHLKTSEGITNKDQRYPATKPQLQGTCYGSQTIEERGHISVHSKHSRRKLA